MSNVRSIFIADNMGEAMRSVDSAHAIAGKGLEGDRYAEGKGAFSRGKVPKIRHVSFIGFEAIDAANARSGGSFTPAETRRNIVTEDIDLNELVGETFAVGDVQLRGTELCDPCARPSKLSGKDGFAEAFHELGGLRAEVLTSGLIVVGQNIDV